MATKFLAYSLSVTVIALASLFASVPAARADITRSCSTSLLVSTSISGGFAQTLGSIEGRGSCRNAAQGDLCRERAHNEIKRCIEGMWRNRHTDAIAPECKTLLPGSGRSGAGLVWNRNHPPAERHRLTARMARAVCCASSGSPSKLQVQVSAVITGDKMCGVGRVGHNQYKSVVKFPNYDMDCNAWRAQGICR